MIFKTSYEINDDLYEFRKLGQLGEFFSMVCPNPFYLSKYVRVLSLPHVMYIFVGLGTHIFHYEEWWKIIDLVIKFNLTISKEYGLSPFRTCKTMSSTCLQNWNVSVYRQSMCIVKGTHLHYDSKFEVHICGAGHCMHNT